MSVISLGSCDYGCIPEDRKAFLKPYHWVGGVLKDEVSFREDDRLKWKRFNANTDGEVKKLQQFLLNAGFMPNRDIDGIFGYRTLASVRLFQEYVRTFEGVEDFYPDGYVGPNTWKHIHRWQEENKVSTWGQASSDNGSDEYNKIMDLLNKAKSHYQQDPSPILKEVGNYPKKTNTLKIEDWKFDPKDVHLIAIRHGQFDYEQEKVSQDVFLLLINGMVFKFWGSTVPNSDMSEKKDLPFLVEGQHIYRFGWHKLSKSKVRAYPALRPSPNGVIVLRYKEGEGTGAKGKVAGKLEANPNHTINIHWSGKGHSSWSAGCMVMAGRSYINNRGDVVDCSEFAATTYSSDSKTKGAYNVFADLVLSYAPVGVEHLYFTLGRDSSLNLDSSLGAGYREQLLKQMTVVL